ncbi:MAG: hypothetical protein ACK5JO_03420 [Halodesulfovibrio sp.]
MSTHVRQAERRGERHNGFQGEFHDEFQGGFRGEHQGKFLGQAWQVRAGSGGR